MNFSRFSRLVVFSLLLAVLPAWGGVVITSGQNLVLESEGGSATVGNLAMGGSAFAENELGVAPHAIPKLNDGLHGNANSWIAGADASFAGVSFGTNTRTVGRIAFGRDVAGGFDDRALALYTLQYTTVANPGVSTPEGSWATIGTLDYQSGGGANFSSVALRHEFSFTPVQATGFRLKMVTAIPGARVCVDELELYPPAGLTLLEQGGAVRTNNLATGKTAFGTAALLAPHAVAAVNDGVFGNASSWLPTTASAFIGIDLGGTPVAVDKIAFGRDNTGALGDRFVGTYEVQFTTEANPSASTAEGSWTTIGTLDYAALPQTGRFSQPARRHLWSFPAVMATGIRLKVVAPSLQVAVDELEIYDASSVEQSSPVITPPANVSVFAALPTSTTAVVTYAAATAVDDTDPAPVLSYSMPSGSTFPVGTTTVMVTATDATGNVGTGTFTVTVVLPTPQIAVEQPASTPLADGVGTVEFGEAISGGSVVKTFTIRNTGNAVMTGLAVTKDGAQAASFTVGALGATELAPTESTTFTVTFSPGIEFMNEAALHIASNVAGAANPFDIALRGTLPCPVITVTPPAVTSGEVGVPFSQTFTQSGGAAPATFAVTSGSLPGGLFLTSSGTLTGTPIVAGNFTLSVMATDFHGCTSAAASYSVTIIGPQMRVEENGLELVVDGSVGAWGNSFLGKTTVPPGLSTGVKAVAAGFFHSLALKNDGTVVGWGEAVRATIPPGLSGVVAISASGNHSLALKSDGTVVAWGGNGAGESTVPPGLSGVVKVEAGEGQSIAVKSDGTVVAWGRNDAGQGNTAGLTGIIAAEANNGFVIYLKNDGTVVVRGSPPGSANPLSTVTNAVAVAAGPYQLMALKSDGTVAIAGLHTTFGGYMIPPAGLENVRSISLGNDLAVVVKNDGTLVRWGTSGNDAYTLPSNPGFVREVSMFYDHALYLSGLTTTGFAPQALLTSSTAKTITLRNTGTGPLTLGAFSTTGNSADFSVSAPAATSIPPGGSTTFTVAFTPQEGATGARNIILSIPSNDPSAAPFLLRFTGTGVDARLSSLVARDGRTLAVQTLSPAFHQNVDAYEVLTPLSRHTQTLQLFLQPVDPAATLTVNGQVVASGTFNSHEFPFGTNTYTIVCSIGAATRTYSLVATRQPPPFRAGLTVEAPGGAVLAPATNVVAWGWNGHGQTTVPGGLSGVKTIAAGGYHNLALKTDGTVIGWGSDFHGQRTVARGITGVRGISAGVMHSLLIRADTTTSAWGWNAYGQTTVPGAFTDTDALSGGYAHSLALDGTGAVHGWGDNSYGQTTIPGDLGDVIAISAGGAHSVALRTDGTLAAWGYTGDGATTIPGGLGQVKAIAAGDSHTLALKVDGTVAAWGRSSDGQTTVPSGLANVVALAAGYQHNLALRRDGTVAAWGGYNAYGETTPPGGLQNVIAIGAGDFHSIALVRSIPVIDLGSQNTGTASTSHAFVFRSTGLSDLVLGTITLEGPHAADFALTAPALSTLVTGSSTTLGIVFTPTDAGARTATLRIPSNDGTDFLVTLTGTGTVAPLGPYPAWKQLHFGPATAQTGDLDDYDSDGVKNLFEFAFGTEPTSPSTGPLSYTGNVITTGQPIPTITNAIFIRRKDHAAAGIMYTVEFSPDLTTWTPSTTTPTVLADDGIHEVVSLPMPQQTKHFFRVKVNTVP